MKKLLSLLLVVTMLMTTFTAMLVTVNAAEDTATVTQVPADTYVIPENLTVVPATVDTAQTTPNWQKLSFGGVGNAVAYKYYLDETWNGSTDNPTNFRVTEAVTVVAQFGGAAKIDSILLKRQSSWAQRMVGFTISLSADGTTWTEVTKLSGVTGNNDVLITLPDSMTGNLYSYVKLTHDAPTAQNGTWLGIGDVKLLASEMETPTTSTVIDAGTYTVPSDLKVISATVLADETTSLDVQDWDGFIMDGFKKDSVTGYSHTTAVDITIVAQFTPAKLDTILFVRNSSFGQRMHSFKVALSANGTDWTEVATLPGYSALSGNKDATIKLSDSLSQNTYQYIKISRQGATGWVGIGGVTLLGTEVMPLNKSTLMDMTHVESSNASLANAWNHSNVTQVDATTIGSKHYTVGKLPSPTVLDKVVLDYPNLGDRARNGLLYGSVDGETWEEIGQVPGTRTANVAMAIQIHSNKAYSYIKVEQADSLKGYTFSLGRINVFGYAENADRITATNVPEMNVTADTTGIDLWSDTNTTSRTGDDKDTVIESTVAKLAFPTKISAIYMVSGELGGRNRGILYEGSVDGITWEKIISSGHQNDHVYSNGTKRVPVNSEKAYLYVRATNTLANGEGKDYHWDVRNLAVYGEMVGATTYGSQVKIATDTYAVRFIATLELLNYENAGFEIHVTGDGLTADKSWDKEIQVVYTTILANGESFTAQDLTGDAYIMAVSLNNISKAKYGNLTFTVKPYVEIDGVRLYGETGIVVYNDGVLVTE